MGRKVERHSEGEKGGRLTFNAAACDGSCAEILRVAYATRSNTIECVRCLLWSSTMIQLWCIDGCSAAALDG